MTDDATALLVQIASQVGELKGQTALILAEQKHASESRREVYQLHSENQAELAILQQSMGRVEGDIKGLKTDVLTFKGFRVQMALAASGVGAIVGGAISLIWLGLTHLGELAGFIRDLMNKH